MEKTTTDSEMIESMAKWFTTGRISSGDDFCAGCIDCDIAHYLSSPPRSPICQVTRQSHGHFSILWCQPPNYIWIMLFLAR